MIIEIFLVIYLALKVGDIARPKGLNVRNWQAYTVILWIVLETAGAFAAWLVTKSGVWVVSAAYGLPLLGHFMLRHRLKKFPEVGNDTNRAADSEANGR